LIDLKSFVNVLLALYHSITGALLHNVIT